MFKSSGKHTIFVDSRERMVDFAPEKFFNTTSEMVNRSENRLTKDQLTQDIFNNKTASSIMPKESLDKKKLRKFKQVKQHVQRETQLKEVQQRMDSQRELLKKGSKKKIVDPTGKSSFKWKKQRKR